MRAEPDRRLRRLPSVDQLVRELEDRPDLPAVPRSRLTECVREVLNDARQRALTDSTAEPDRAAIVTHVVAALSRSPFSLRAVINATGVVLHTGLGRAVLAPAVIERLVEIGSSYSNLELELGDKRRGSRSSHVAALLRRLTGAEDALVVNNNAAAVLLALDSLARGREVIVSRGELIEIGGEFRIPDILLRSGAVLREVGTTNRTHLADYAGAIGLETALLLKVHPSNYRVVGFTSAVESRELAALGRERGLPVMEDLGSGSLIDLRPFGLPDEPTVSDVVRWGVDLIAFSGDKLLGGPQAGIVVGTHTLVDRLKKNPLHRALRIDKLTLVALEATLNAYDEGRALDTLPTLRMLTEPVGAVRARAEQALRLLSPSQVARLGAMLVEVSSQVGGGALPLVELPTAAIAIGTPAVSAESLDERLRRSEPAVLGRLADDRLVLDCRTVLPTQVPDLARALAAL